MIIGNCPVCGAEMRVGTDMTNADRWCVARIASTGNICPM